MNIWKLIVSIQGQRDEEIHIEAMGFYEARSIAINSWGDGELIIRSCEFLRKD